MNTRPINPAFLALRERIAQLEGDGERTREVLPFGVPPLDRSLPGGGLGCLHEVAGGGNGALDGAAAPCFVAGITARAPGKVLWCVAQQDLFAPGLEQAGLAPDRVIHVEAGDDKSVLACMEEGLRHGGLCCDQGLMLLLLQAIKIILRTQHLLHVDAAVEPRLAHCNVLHHGSDRIDTFHALYVTPVEQPTCA